MMPKMVQIRFVQTIENWLLFMACKIDANGDSMPDKRHSCAVIQMDTVVKMATYDRKFLHRTVVSSESCVTLGIGLTFNQVMLAKKIILKYKRQFAQKGISVDEIEKITESNYTQYLSFPVRRVTRDNEISLVVENGEQVLMLKFKYNKPLINTLESCRSNMFGSCYYSGSGTWYISASQRNIGILRKCKSFTALDWKIDPQIAPYFETEIDYDATDTLTINDGRLCFSGCHSSAVESMISHGFDGDVNKLLHWSIIAHWHGIWVSDAALSTIKNPAIRSMFGIYSKTYPIQHGWKIVNHLWRSMSLSFKDTVELIKMLPEYSFVFNCPSTSYYRYPSNIDKLAEMLNAAGLSNVFLYRRKPLDIDGIMEKFGCNPKATFIVDVGGKSLSNVPENHLIRKVPSFNLLDPQISKNITPLDRVLGDRSRNAK